MFIRGEKCGDKRYVYHSAGIEKVIEKLFAHVPPPRIVWISVGTLRFNPELKTVIEKRFPGNTILDEEHVIDFDGKMRYPDTLRYEIYKKMVRLLRRYSYHIRIYLCMESQRLYRSLSAELSWRKGR